MSTDGTPLHALYRDMRRIHSLEETHVSGNDMQVCPRRWVAQETFAVAARFCAGEQVRESPRSKAPLPHSGEEP